MDVMVNIEKIRSRKAEIAAERQRLDEEDSELDTALAVIERFVDPPVRKVETTETGNAKRPKGAPTLWVMVNGLLAHPSHRDGLTGGALVQLIGVTHWPGVSRNQVLPGIYRFLKEGRLVKDAEGRFHLPSQ